VLGGNHRIIETVNINVIIQTPRHKLTGSFGAGKPARR